MKAGYREIECTVSVKSSLFFQAPENAIVMDVFLNGKRSLHGRPLFSV